MDKRKRKAITTARKIEIIEYQEQNSSTKKTEIAEHFELSKQTLNDILKNKSKIREEAQKARSDSAKRKRFRSVTFEDVDMALIIWFRQYQAKPDLRIDGLMLVQKAMYFSKKFGNETSPDMSWIERWKKRWNIGKILKSGEAGGVDSETVDEWRANVMKGLLHKYKPCDIYNCDETGLFWQTLPDQSHGFRGEKLSGQKQAKARITLLVGTNMDGSEKMPLFAIGKSKKPRAFKNIKQIPVRYEANPKAWMRSDLFEAEMKRFDRRMKLQGRKVVMIVDNCPAHPAVELENTELVFLPPNTTSITQPMDSGIIKNLKFFYRRNMAARRLEAAETETPFKWDMLDCLIAVKSSWRQVKTSTVVNCWRQAGFVADDANRIDDHSPDPMNDEAEETRTFRNIWDKLSEVLQTSLPDIDQYVSIDNDDETHDILSDEDIVWQCREELAGGNADDETEDEPRNDPESTPPPTVRDVRHAVEVLRRFVMNSDTLEDKQDDLLDAASKFDDALLRVSQRGKQSRITDFFKYAG